MSWRPFEGRTSDSNDLDNVLKAEVAMVTSWQDDVRSLECRCKMHQNAKRTLFGSVWKHLETFFEVHGDHSNSPVAGSA